MMTAEPSEETSDLITLLLGQLSYLRGALLDKLDGLSDDQLRGTVLPSGWTPLGLLKHLAFCERRWVEWGFQGQVVAAPWGDHDPDGDGWLLSTGDSLSGLTEFLTERARVTETVAATATLNDKGRLGGRFETTAPTLGWILLHLVQEYARHVGHIDIARELIDGRTGE